MMKRFMGIALVGLSASLVACGGGPTMVNGKAVLAPDKDSGRKGTGSVSVSKEAAATFDGALDKFVEHDKKQDWADGTCSSVADTFIKAASSQKSDARAEFPEAIYNAGLAYQRCGKDADARAKFEDTLKADGGFHRAKAQLALYDFSKSGDIDGTITKLDQIIRDAKFQNVEGLVALAALQMERGNDQADGDGKNDLERAQRNLQRALAIDDSYMPAFNQLAVYYLEQAKAKAGASAKKGRRGRRGMEVSGVKSVDVDEQQLDLAALVASQAQRKNPNYAPIHNTTGLIQVQLKNFNGAVKSFGRARQLDSKFFEAHMNYAAVSLSFRGYEEAEKAYRDALKVRPKEFEAHLGLALALRGQINDGNFEKMVAAAKAELDEAKKIDGTRAETYYNEAILTHEFKAKRAAGPTAVPELEKAAQQYRDFVTKAGDGAEFADAVKRSKERSTDIDDTIKFIREGAQAEKDAAEAEKAAKEQAAQQAKDDKAAADKAAADKAAADKAAAEKAGADKAAADKAAADKAAKPGDKAAPAGGAAAPAPAGKAPAAPAKK
jgi:lipoprotein NlpI